MSAATQEFNGSDDLDLRLLVLTLWRRRWWIVASVILVAGLFVAVAFLMTPIYRAKTVAIPAGNDSPGFGALGSALGQFGGLASLAGINIGNSGTLADEALAVLRSREFTEAFIRDRDLMPLLFASRWDAEARRWRGDAEDAPTPARAFKYFDETVRKVTQDKKTGLVTLEIEWRDPVVAAAWANDLIGRLNAEMRARAIANTNASMGYLEKELGSTNTVETREAINRLIEAQINQRMFANVTEQYALRVVDRALPPDVKDVARPKKVLLLALGLALGGLFGVLGVLAYESLRAPRSVSSAQ